MSVATHQENEHRALLDRVLVKRQESAHKSASGIVIPCAASEQPGQAVKAGDEGFHVMREEDITAVL